MKKHISIITVVFLVISCFVVLTACGEDVGVSKYASNSDMNAGSGHLSGSSSGSGLVDGHALAKHKTIGKRELKTTTKTVTLLNLTGQDITGFVIKHSLEETFGVNMLEESDVFQLDETRDIYYDIAAALDAQAALSAEEKSEHLYLTYDIQLTVADGSSYVIHDFPFNEIEQGRILLQNGVAFLEYLEPWTGEEVITRQKEIEVQAAEKAAQEEAERIAAEQAWISQQQQLQQQQQWQQQYVSPAPSNDTGCVGDNGLVY